MIVASMRAAGIMFSALSFALVSGAACAELLKAPDAVVDPLLIFDWAFVLPALAWAGLVLFPPSSRPSTVSAILLAFLSIAIGLLLVVLVHVMDPTSSFVGSGLAWVPGGALVGSAVLARAMTTRLVPGRGSAVDVWIGVLGACISITLVPRAVISDLDHEIRSEIEKWSEMSRDVRESYVWQQRARYEELAHRYDGLLWYPFSDVRCRKALLLNVLAWVGGHRRDAEASRYAQACVATGCRQPLGVGGESLASECRLLLAEQPWLIEERSLKHVARVRLGPRRVSAGGGSVDALGSTDAFRRAVRAVVEPCLDRGRQARALKLRRTDPEGVCRDGYVLLVEPEVDLALVAEVVGELSFDDRPYVAVATPRGLIRVVAQPPPGARLVALGSVEPTTVLDQTVLVADTEVKWKDVMSRLAAWAEKNPAEKTHLVFSTRAAQVPRGG